jgi:hypothetical protein
LYERSIIIQNEFADERCPDRGGKDLTMTPSFTLNTMS